MKYVAAVFGCVFACSLVIQSLIWHAGEFIDRSMWAEHTQHFFPLTSQAYHIGVFGHPGTTIVMLTNALHTLFGGSYYYALESSLTVFNALTIAAASSLAAFLRPAQPWWIAVAGLLIINRLYLLATPPTAAIMPLAALLALATLALLEHPPSKALITLWATTAGLAAATRFDITGALALASLPLLLWRLRPRQLVGLIVISCAVFVAFNPFMWREPLTHLASLTSVMHRHYANFRPSSPSLASLLLTAPIATVGLVLASIVSLTPRRLIPASLPRPYLIWLIAATATISLILLNAVFVVPRYFFPLIVIWEIITPLIILDLLAHFRLPPTLRPQVMRASLAAALIVLLIGSHALLLVHLRTLPTGISVL